MGEDNSNNGANYIVVVHSKRKVIDTSDNGADKFLTI